MRCIILLLLALCLPVTVHAGDSSDPNAAWNQPANWQASISASTSGTINGIVMNDKPQLSLNVSGRKNDLYFGSNFQTVDSNLGTNSQDQFFLGYNQQFVPFALRWQVTYKAYPGTEATYNDSGVDYQVTASHPFFGFNASLGAEYTDADYSTVRKSYGLNASISRGLLPKLSGWLSISHKHQWGSVDYTNTNIGLYYQLTQKIGVSTSVNNWHAYADWAHDNPTFSISLSRRL